LSTTGNIKTSLGNKQPQQMDLMGELDTVFN